MHNRGSALWVGLSSFRQCETFSTLDINVRIGVWCGERALNTTGATRNRCFRLRNPTEMAISAIITNVATTPRLWQPFGFGCLVSTVSEIDSRYKTSKKMHPYLGWRQMFPQGCKDSVERHIIFSSEIPRQHPLVEMNSSPEHGFHLREQANKEGSLGPDETCLNTAAKHGYCVLHLTNGTRTCARNVG